MHSFSAQIFTTCCLQARCYGLFQAYLLLIAYVFIQLFFFYINIFIYLWLHWVFVAVRGLSLVAATRGYSSLRCAGFSLWWLLLLRSMGSRCAGFSSCGTWAQLLRGMQDLPGPGFKPVSPALAGGFLTTAPPGKSIQFFLTISESIFFQLASFSHSIIAMQIDLVVSSFTESDCFL